MSPLPLCPFHSQWLAIYDHFHLQRLAILFRADLVQGVFVEALTRVLASFLHHLDGTLLPGSLLTTSRSSRLVSLTSVTPWLLTPTNNFDVTHFDTIITLGRVERTLGGSVAVLDTPKTTRASLSTHFMDFCLETSSCVREFSWLPLDFPHVPSGGFQSLSNF